MRYEQRYREAINKVTASEQWKADTLQKMAQQTRRPPVLLAVKRAALPAAAAVAIVSAALLLPDTGGLATTNDAAGGQSAPVATTEPSFDLKEAAPQPRAAMFSAELSLPSLAFSADQLAEVDAAQLPVAVDLTAQSLPVWQMEEGQALLMGEYPLLDAQQAAEAAGIGEYTEAALVYAESMTYLQPCYRFVLKTQDAPVYAAAICGEYY